MLTKLASLLILIFTFHALLIHTMANEVDFWEIFLLEALWLILLFTQEFNDETKRGLLTLFALYSGYFLPRTLELSKGVTLHLLSIDVFFNNLFFSLIDKNLKMMVVTDKVMIVYGKQFIAEYLIGCSSLRAIPMLISAVLFIPATWRKKIFAMIIPSVLVFPSNAFRVAAIVLFSEYFKVNMWVAHILLSPALTVILVTLLMEIQDRILHGLLFKYITIGFEALLKNIVS